MSDEVTERNWQSFFYRLPIVVGCFSAWASGWLLLVCCWPSLCGRLQSRGCPVTAPGMEHPSALLCGSSSRSRGPCQVLVGVPCQTLREQDVSRWHTGKSVPYRIRGARRVSSACVSPDSGLFGASTSGGRQDKPKREDGRRLALIHIFSDYGPLF